MNKNWWQDKKVASSGGVRSMFNVEHVQPQPQIAEYNINAGQNRLPELRDEICSQPEDAVGTQYGCPAIKRSYILLDGLSGTKNIVA